MRHVRQRKGKYYFWVPSATLAKLGYSCEALGTDVAKALSRAAHLNSEADKCRAKGTLLTAQELPAHCIKRLSAQYDQKLDARLLNGSIKPRTVKDYRKLMPVIVEHWGAVDIDEMTTNLIETWLENEPNKWTRYHQGLMMRTFLTWCEGEVRGYEMPAFAVSTPKARKVKWDEEQIWQVVAQLKSNGWLSLAVGTLVEWCLGQNPADIWRLPSAIYINGAIDITRTKTDEGGDPIPLWADIRDELDAYLTTSPAIGNAPLFRNEATGGYWVESTRLKAFARARDEAGLPKKLQMRDLRRTAITEALSAGFTSAQTRSLSRHATVAGMAAYDAIHASAKVIDVQAGRDAQRRFNKDGKKG